MKRILFIFIIITIVSCNHTDKSRLLQSRVDSLEKRLANTYKPGFGEFMSAIQVHHSKLWFAGQNQNWKLADFEVHEIMEALDNIQKYQTDRKESKMIGMLNPAIDSVSKAIQQKNSTTFKRSYVLLTNTCNNCHRAANFEFNVIKVPETPPFSNQDFKLNEPK